MATVEPTHGQAREEIFQDGVLLAEGYLALALKSFRRAVEAAIEIPGEATPEAREHALREAVEAAAANLQAHHEVHDFLKAHTLDALRD